jgi:transposase-like protein
MAKYSFELKQKVVQAHLSGEGGYKYLAKKYAIVSESVVKRWVKAYKKFGSDGLIDKVTVLFVLTKLIWHDNLRKKGADYHAKTTRHLRTLPF